MNLVCSDCEQTHTMNFMNRRVGGLKELKVETGGNIVMIRRRVGGLKEGVSSAQIMNRRLGGLEIKRVNSRRCKKISCDCKTMHS